MIKVNIHQAKTNFSKLIHAVLEGNEVIIAKSGKPAARLVPISEVKPKRTPGALKGKIKVAADFDAPLPERILDEFEGK